MDELLLLRFLPPDDDVEFVDDDTDDVVVVEVVVALYEFGETESMEEREEVAIPPLMLLGVIPFLPPAVARDKPKSCSLGTLLLFGESLGPIEDKSLFIVMML